MPLLSFCRYLKPGFVAFGGCFTVLIQLGSRDSGFLIDRDEFIF
jgi:hypothetical protein